ncbi:MAG: hypothetical protein GXY06_03300 [Clostridiaceae bacterium]|nr:hypothetical protein [Clostridiaceae bacterium]
MRKKMKIVSLNINNFGGFKCKKNCGYEYWKKLDKTEEATEILGYIQFEKPDISVLHEFELNAEIAKEFIKSMNLLGYEIVPIEQHNYKYPSITIMFVRKELLFNKLENPHKEKSLRASVIKAGEFIVYGLHIPPVFDISFWDEMIDFYKQHDAEKLVIIGDYNVYDIGTEQKQKFLELLSLNAKDAWLEKGNANSTRTHIKGRRLDYAVMTPSLFECLIDIRIDPLLLNNGKTDHAALIIEI